MKTNKDTEESKVMCHSFALKITVRIEVSAMGENMFPNREPP